jgi:hypothetical protein
MRRPFISLGGIALNEVSDSGIPTEYPKTAAQPLGTASLQH